MPNLIKIGRQVDKLVRVAKATKVPVDVKVPHPLKPGEMFTFPPGTDPELAKEVVRKMLLAKARKGEEVVEVAPSLPPERIQALEQAEQELERVKRTVADLESRKDITKMEPGTYLDDNTGKYYRVTKSGLIEELVIK